MTNTTLTFQSTTFDVIDRNGQPWLRLPQIEGALGYTNRGKGLFNIYKAHADEFTDAMTAVIKLPTAGGEQETRIFSPRGCHALGMFARTKVAKAFRVWVLDVLEGKAALPARPALTHEPLTPAMQRQIQNVIADKVHASGKGRSGYVTVYRAIKNHFAVGSYTQIPAEKHDELLSFLDGIVLEGELLPPEETSALAATIQPPTWERPLPAGMPEAIGNRTVIQLRSILTSLALWVENQPFQHETRRALGDALADIRSLVITSSTEIQEALCQINLGVAYLNRWRGVKPAYTPKRYQ